MAAILIVHNSKRRQALYEPASSFIFKMPRQMVSTFSRLVVPDWPLVRPAVMMISSPG